MGIVGPEQVVGDDGFIRVQNRDDAFQAKPFVAVQVQ
jgi:hypothetical protein